MTRQTKRFILTVAATIMSLGVIGWLIWKLGALDMILYVIIQLALFFPMMLVAMTVLNESTYNMMEDQLTNLVKLLNQKISKGEALTEEEV